LLDRNLDFTQSHSMYFPFVTAGCAFVINIFDTMACQLFYNADILRFVDLLLSLDHAPSSTPRHTHATSGRLGRIPVPREVLAEGGDFAYLFDTMMLHFQAIPFALYRLNVDSDFYYLYTGPEPDTVLQHTDFVFFVAPHETMPEILRRYPLPKSNL
jgi:hypothetical protein